MRGAATATAVGAGTGLALYVAFRAGAWLVEAGAGFYFRAVGWRETRQASKESAS